MTAGCSARRYCWSASTSAADAERATARTLDRLAEREPRGPDQTQSAAGDAARRGADFDALDMPALLNALIAGGAAIEVLYVHGHWRGVNDLDDLRQAVDFAHAQTPFASMIEARAFRRSSARTGISLVCRGTVFLS